jgi:hypothetical protein
MINFAVDVVKVDRLEFNDVQVGMLVGLENNVKKQEKR